MSRYKAQVLAYHGWGFDHSFWDLVTSELGDKYKMIPADRGYFGDESAPKWDPSQSELPKIVIAHSYGIHWCPEEKISSADGLLLVNSFIQFHPQKPVEFEASKRLTRALMTSLNKKPEVGLNEFKQLAYLPSKAPRFKKDLTHVDIDLLLNDLTNLDRDNHRVSPLQKKKSIRIIHGKSDQIVSIDLARRMQKEFFPYSRILEVEEGGHMLPRTHPKYIANQIKSLAESLS
jgi:pimeloyl-[acyl-carrier protein] methyl ester esterase